MLLLFLKGNISIKTFKTEKSICGSSQNTFYTCSFKIPLFGVVLRECKFFLQLPFCLTNKTKKWQGKKRESQRKDISPLLLKTNVFFLFLSPWQFNLEQRKMTSYLILKFSQLTWRYYEYNPIYSNFKWEEIIFRKASLCMFYFYN